MSESSSEEAEFNGDLEEEEEEEAELESSEEDVPLATLKKNKPDDNDRKRSAAQNVSYAEDDDNDDDDESSEDDVPLASLAKKKKPEPKKNGANKKVATARKDKASPKKKKAKKTLKKKGSTVSAKSAASEKSYEWASMALYGTECTKGLLIQRLLCRWWYAFEWPDTSKLPDRPPPNHDSLDGFVGVYVCTSGENVGQILDMRDKSKCPSFQNFAKKSAEELKDLLLKALQEQKRKLVEAEGAGTDTKKELDRLIKWTNKVNADKADREAKKVLKASRLELP